MNKLSKRLLASFAIIIFLIATLFTILNQFYIDYIWFNEVGYTQVFLKELVTKVQIGVPSFVVFLVLLFVYFKFINSIISKSSNNVRNIKNKVLLGISFVLSLFLTIITTNALWYRILEFINAKSFNYNDPIFNKDISFYVFKLPLLEQLYISLSSIFFIILVATIIFTVFIFLNSNRKIVYDQESLNSDIKNIFLSIGNAASKQIGIFLGVFFFLLTFNYYIKAYTLLYSSTGIAYGASYTDVVITLPLYRVLMGLTIILGIASIVFGLGKKLKYVLITPVILIVVTFIGGLVTLGVDNFIVAPNQYSKEEPYLVNNIEYTQMAYDVADVNTLPFSVNAEITKEDLKENEITMNNIPINDYRPTLEMYNSLQGFRRYYQFNDIDIDRYKIDDVYTQVFISARELNNNKLEENAKTWINQHLKYTHGYGVAVSPVNKVNETGQPSLVLQDIPPKTQYKELEVEQPRIYFGESTDSYAITNCVTKEFDFPQGSDNAENYYEGTAGIDMSFINRIAFALYHGNFKILLSSDITSDSKMLINRNITERVSKVAPFLSFDEDPYVVIADGKLYWIIDAFTTSDRYPYSQPYDENNAFNYLRNSVKVVIDAYNGDVNLYQVDNEDPIANVYNSIYPDIFKPFSDMPQEIKGHVRYSQNMFDIQSDVYRTYHMTNPRVFYNKEDQWEIANQLFGQDKDVEKVESSYLIMKQPERDGEEFVLMIPYTPREKDNMVGWMAAMNDEDNYGDLLVYTFPKQNLAYGPMQIEQRIDQDTTISPQLTLLGQQGSAIMRGNMLTIPINDSVLYVEPVYIGASGGERSLPELKKVIVSYGNRIYMGDSLGEALNNMFGDDEDSGNDENDDIIDNGDGNNEITGDTATLIKRAKDLFNNAQEAQRNGNWSQYGEYINQLEEVLNQLDLDQITTN